MGRCPKYHKGCHEGGAETVQLVKTYRSNVKKQIPKIPHNPIDILVPLQKPMPLAIRDLADDVKGVELQPADKVTAGGVVGIEALGLFEEQLDGVVHERLVLHQRRHGEGRVHAPPQLRVEPVVRRAEERREPVAFRYALLDDVEIGLFFRVHLFLR